jgi:sec1 family domain-containing protein 1
MPQSLRDRQIGTWSLNKCHFLTAAASIQKILNLNKDVVESHDDQNTYQANGFLPEATPVINNDGEPIWKVLVFDNLGRDVISSVMRVNDLRTCGVTIHLSVCRAL